MVMFNYEGKVYDLLGVEYHSDNTATSLALYFNNCGSLEVKFPNTHRIKKYVDSRYNQLVERLNHINSYELGLFLNAFEAYGLRRVSPEQELEWGTYSLDLKGVSKGRGEGIYVLINNSNPPMRKSIISVFVRTNYMSVDAKIRESRGVEIIGISLSANPDFRIDFSVGAVTLSSLRRVYSEVHMKGGLIDSLKNAFKDRFDTSGQVRTKISDYADRMVGNYPEITHCRIKVKRKLS